MHQQHVRGMLAWPKMPHTDKEFGYFLFYPRLILLGCFLKILPGHVVILFNGLLSLRLVGVVGARMNMRSPHPQQGPG